MDLSRILNAGTHASVKATSRPVPSPENTDRNLRVGKWTEEEERFAVELIRHFLTGSISTATPGTSLRSFLAKKLRCSPMRISTKLAVDTLGGERIPKRLGQKRYFPMETVAVAERHRIATELHELESAFLEKEHLEMEDDGCGEGDATMSICSDDDAMSDDSSTAVRIGSWSDEEQVYAAALIDGFLRGLLDQPQGMTLRAFLAEQLCCNPMRISKKLATGVMANQALPKRLGSATFQPAISRSPHQVTHTEAELVRLRSACFAPAKGPGHAPMEQNESIGDLAQPNGTQQMPVSPLEPLSKKRLYTDEHPQLPSLSQVCKRQVFSHSIMLN